MAEVVRVRRLQPRRERPAQSAATILKVFWFVARVDGRNERVGSSDALSLILRHATRAGPDRLLRITAVTDVTDFKADVFVGFLNLSPREVPALYE